MIKSRIFQEAKSYAKLAHKTVAGNSHLTGVSEGRRIDQTKVDFYLFALVELTTFGMNPLLDLAESADKIKDLPFGMDSEVQDAVTVDFLNQLAARFGSDAIFQIAK